MSGIIERGVAVEPALRAGRDAGRKLLVTYVTGGLGSGWVDALRAMVEGSGARNNGFSTMDISADGTIRISGYREQKSYKWSPA